jgi:hypothetical protein
MIEIFYVFLLVPLRSTWEKISITRGRSTGLSYQRMKEPIILTSVTSFAAANTSATST